MTSYFVCINVWPFAEAMHRELGTPYTLSIHAIQSAIDLHIMCLHPVVYVEISFSMFGVAVRS
jgi:hypothetical protein